MVESIYYSGEIYPKMQKMGFASQFAIPYAKQFCNGIGYDIGFGKEEWKFPNSIGIDSSLNNGYDAIHLPEQIVDYIFSSHCLEHVDDWVSTLEYWISKIKSSGVLFLYLPDFSQKYWRPWNNRKHKNVFTPSIIEGFLLDHNMKNIFISGIDLNNSFMVVCEK
jgi:hypothetical protein